MTGRAFPDERIRWWLAAHSRNASVAALSVAVILGLYVRLWPVVSADFPLNDGGLFYLMTEEIQRARYALPVYTSYNSAQIPFAYPPLAFYIAGLISDVAGWSLLDVVRLLPAIVSTLTIPAFFLLGRAILQSTTQAVVAAFAFAMLPRSFTWFIMGGGLTRAPGFLFAVLMLHQAYLLYTRRNTRFVFSTVLFGSLAVLSHPENTWFAVYSAVFLFLFYGRDRRGLVNSLLVVAGVLVLTAPWWMTVMSRHGLSPLLAAGAGGGYGWFSLSPLKTFNFTDEVHLSVFGVLGLLGVFASLAERRFFLPFWLLAIFVVNPRNPATVATVPLAMLIGIAADRLVLSGIYRLGVANRPRGGVEDPAAERGKLWPVPYVSRTFPLVVLGLMISYFVGYTFLATRSVTRHDAGLQVLPAEERDAMRWIAANTPDHSTFLVLNFAPGWFGEDRASEWFPALARRASLTTVQGYEWLPGGQFHRRMGRYGALRECATRDVSCLDRWAASGGVAFTHVYLPKQGCCGGLEDSIRASPDYALVYGGTGPTIFSRQTTD